MHSLEFYKDSKLSWKITTEEDFPGPPRNFQINITKPDSFNIVWEEPEEPNGKILGYQYNITGVPINKTADEGRTDIAHSTIGLVIYVV